MKPLTKIKAALSYVMPIVWLGETLTEREADQTQEVIQTQITESLANLSDATQQQIIVCRMESFSTVMGKTATPKQAGRRAALFGKPLPIFSPSIADQLRILYGGSVKPDNTHELLAQENIDGALVGGASLQAELFIEIINRELDRTLQLKAQLQRTQHAHLIQNNSSLLLVNAILTMRIPAYL